jgi:hypothetical protein
MTILELVLKGFEPLDEAGTSRLFAERVLLGTTAPADPS